MKTKNWFWGFFFLLCAIFVVAGQTGWFKTLDFITIIATVLLAALLVSSIAKKEIFGVVFPLGFLYYIYQQPLGLPHLSWWKLLLTVLFLGTGLSILFRKTPPPAPHAAHTGWQQGPDSSHTGVDSNETIEGQQVYAKVHFGSSVKHLRSAGLKSGRFDVSFGAMEVYFDHAALDAGGAEIFVECSFGSIRLHVPRNWRVRDDIRSTLGGVTNVNRYGEAPQGSPVLTLSGNIQFSGVEILYV